MTALAQEEIDSCRDAFLAFDKDRSGTIDVWELRQVLEGELEGDRKMGIAEFGKWECFLGMIWKLVLICKCLLLLRLG